MENKAKLPTDEQIQKRTIMAIGGHIGDMELTAGMLLAKKALEGCRIITVALTAGERGVPAGREISDYRKQKVQEAEAFAKKLGGEAVVLSYSDGELPDNDETRLQVCDLIRKYKPDTVITHYASSMHKDHNATHRIVTDARYYASLPGLPREFPRHFARNLFYAENWEDAVGFKPYIYVDTTEGYELWKEAVALHWFVTGSTSFPYLEYYDALSRVRGIEARTGRAECFMVSPEEARILKDNI